VKELESNGVYAGSSKGILEGLQHPMVGDLSTSKSRHQNNERLEAHKMW